MPGFSAESWMLIDDLCFSVSVKLKTLLQGCFLFLPFFPSEERGVFYQI